MRQWRRAVVAVAVTAVLSACSSSAARTRPVESTPREGGTATTTSAAPSTAVAPDPLAQQAALAELQTYLDEWSRNGPEVAAAGFLVPSQAQCSAQRPCGPPITSGQLKSACTWSWESSDHFTLLVTLALHFPGSTAAWNEGTNSRFVTFSRASGATRFLLEFNTGPSAPPMRSTCS